MGGRGHHRQHACRQPSSGAGLWVHPLP
jgi:hypothetical protein